VFSHESGFVRIGALLFEPFSQICKRQPFRSNRQGGSRLVGLQEACAAGTVFVKRGEDTDLLRSSARKGTTFYRRDGSEPKAGSWSFATQSSQSKMPSANFDPGRYPQGMRL